MDRVLVRFFIGRCNMNNEEMSYGDVRTVEALDSYSKSADMIFLIEAKDCNKNIWSRKKMETLLTALELDLNKENFKYNRFGVVAFGGSGVYDRPVIVSSHNQEYQSSPLGLKDHFGHIYYTQGNKCKFM